MKKINRATNIGYLKEEDYKSLDKISKMIYDYVADTFACPAYIANGLTPKDCPEDFIGAAMVYQMAESVKHNIIDKILIENI